MVKEMEYGAMNSPIKPVTDEIKEVRSLGFDYLELTIDAPEATPQKITAEKNKILDLLSSHNLKLIGHLPCFVSTADLYQSIRNASRKEVLDALEMLPQLGIEKAVLHPSYMSGLGKLLKDEIKKLGHQFLSEVCDKANELGIVLCLENMTLNEGWLFNPEEFKDVLKTFKEIKLTLDLGHANVMSEENRALKFLKLYRRRIGHLHISDNFGLRDDHLPIYCGQIKFDKILSELKKTGYNETITLEIFASDRDYLRLSLEKVKRLWKRL